MAMACKGVQLFSFDCEETHQGGGREQMVMSSGKYLKKEILLPKLVFLLHVISDDMTMWRISWRVGVLVVMCVAFCKERRLLH